jgi:nitrite reductase/ring-hydroxylating ferredoxin subunit
MIVRVSGDIITTDALCTHQQADLSLGLLFGCVVSCPLHHARFDVRTGQVVEGPDDGAPESIPPLMVYNNRIQDEELWIDV